MFEDGLIDQNQKVRDALVSIFERYGVRFMRFTTRTFAPPERSQKVRKVLVIMTSHMNKVHITYDTGCMSNPKIPVGTRQIIPQTLKPFNMDEVFEAMMRLGREKGFGSLASGGRGYERLELWITGGSHPVGDEEMKKFLNNGIED